MNGDKPEVTLSSGTGFTYGETPATGEPSVPRIPMQFPSGKFRWVPQNRMQDAVKAGAKPPSTVNARPLGPTQAAQSLAKMPPRTPPQDVSKFFPFGNTPTLDVMKGAAKGPVGDVSNIMKMVGAGGTAAGKKMEELATPATPTQAYAKTGEQVAEFMIPGLGEEAAAARFGPRLAPYIVALAKSLQTGATEGAHSGTWGGAATGMATGAASEAAGLTAKLVGPRILKAVFGVEEKYGGKAGEELLKGKGLFRGSINRNAKKELDKIEMQVAASLPGHPGTVDMNPIYTYLASAGKGTNEAERSAMKNLGKTVMRETGGAPSISLEKAEAIREKVNRMVDWGSKKEGYVSKAARQVHDQVESGLMQGAPELKEALFARRGLNDIIEATERPKSINWGSLAASTSVRAVPGFIGWDIGREKAGIWGGLAGMAAGVAAGPAVFSSGIKGAASPLLRGGVVGTLMEGMRGSQQDEKPKPKRNPFQFTPE